MTLSASVSCDGDDLFLSLFGIVTPQTILYFQNFPKDKLWLKLVVSISHRMSARLSLVVHAYQVDPDVMPRFLCLSIFPVQPQGRRTMVSR